MCAINVDNNSTMMQLLNYVLRYVEMEKDSCLTVMTVTTMMEMAAVEIVKCREDISAEVVHLTQMIVVLSTYLLLSP